MWQKQALRITRTTAGLRNAEPVGIEHIGVGLDFDGVSNKLRDGLKTTADYSAWVAGLQARGYQDDAIRKILGGNLLRVWAAIEAGKGGSNIVK